MVLIKILPDWFLPESQATSETDYLNRRRFIKKAGLGSLSIMGLLASCQTLEEKKSIVKQKLLDERLKAITTSRNLAFILDAQLRIDTVPPSTLTFTNLAVIRMYGRRLANFSLILGQWKYLA